MYNRKPANTNNLKMIDENLLECKKEKNSKNQKSLYQKKKKKQKKKR